MKKKAKKSILDLVERTGISRMSQKSQAVVDNNSVSQAKISMRQEVMKTQSQARLNKHLSQNIMILHNQKIKSAVSVQRNLNSAQGQADDDKSQSHLDNQNYIATVNLSKHINQGIQRDIIDRNKKSVLILSKKNQKFIQKQKQIEKHLVPGTIEKMKNIRPSHSINEILKSFGKTKCDHHHLPEQDLAHCHSQKIKYNPRNTCMNVYNQILNYKIQKDELKDKHKANETHRIYNNGNTFLGSFNSIFEKQKNERIENVTKLLNYKKKVDMDKQNQDFEE